MDKQKQIEEMAEDLQYCIVYESDDSWQAVFDEFAENFYNEGYRKIPENAVVLTREAYNRLFTKARQSEIKTIDLESIVNARKKTAEKFAKLTKAKLNEWLEDNEDNDGKIDFGIAEIELIGVETLEGEVISESLIDEIAKEIKEGKV